MIEKIVGVAIRTQNGKLYALGPPDRHSDVIALMTKDEYYNSDQGFVTNNFRFVDREEGLKIAKEANQIIRQAGDPDYLSSENLW